MVSVKDKAKQMKLESSKMATQPIEKRNAALAEIADALLKNKEFIIEENEKDLQYAKECGLADPVIKRLKFDEGKLKGVVEGIRELIKLPDPLFKTLLKRSLDEGLTLYRETCAIGVIGVIFESRPDAMVQISTLCIKSGNCAILKGGSEAANTNRAIFNIIHSAAVKMGMPEYSLVQAEERNEITELLDCHEYVDLLIPRGSNAFVQYIMNNTKIPVMGHADGICHVYVDSEADIDKAVKVVVDAKTQYVSVCNATETLLVNEKIAGVILPKLKEALEKKNVEIRGTKEVMDIIACAQATEEDFAAEYLDYIVSVKLVKSVQEAVEHINYYGSHHTDAIITESKENAEYFMQYVDSAGVYQNCSTRFADGFRYGFGAEVGVSTGKLHARGPVGLEGLVTYKYKLFGDGHIVDDYASGRKQFNFREESL